MGSWIPLSKLCLCGIVATPDQQGSWCWSVDGTDWRYNDRRGLTVEVFHVGAWRPLANVGTLNHAVAFSLGWRARNQFPADAPVTLPADDLTTPSQQTQTAPA